MALGNRRRTHIQVAYGTKSKIERRKNLRIRHSPYQQLLVFVSWIIWYRCRLGVNVDVGDRKAEFRWS